jgi:hypothetical protein
MSIARLVIVEGKFTACLVAAVLGLSVLGSTARTGAGTERKFRASIDCGICQHARSAHGPALGGGFT